MSEYPRTYSGLWIKSPRSSSPSFAVSAQLKRDCGKCWQKNKKRYCFNQNQHKVFGWTAQGVFEKEKSWTESLLASSQNCITNATILWRWQEDRIQLAPLKDVTGLSGVVQNSQTNFELLKMKSRNNGYNHKQPQQLWIINTHLPFADIYYHHLDGLGKVLREHAEIKLWRSGCLCMCVVLGRIKSIY